MTVSTVTRQEIVDFLYTEAKILDEWRLKEWAALFTDDGIYEIPPLGVPDADPKEYLFFAHDTRSRLQERAERLLKKEAHVEYPHSTTIHNYNNILVSDLESDVITVECNFTIHRTKREVLDTFIGKHFYELVLRDGTFAIKSKKVVLHLDSLRPHGKISLIL
ncbi:aromatic-ring-hydroxylating dioxygenase subunit beta [Salinicoccus halitifaciens]|uniref:p-cumate 2,3-dioxygenase beta subunit n=1 Tax=Salinicoccus halitifaciens TaxID=1073415 RepID=A0ABV2EC43_9STAP|nr:aromatic-ring-hydroxylating dioxygenase subunit beta [Salinicoccus halitifaciens]MCD2137341.1 aromatic-ring-hydroxylating dioxygenase subunit beta [Salinicoccus halitifaciens]